jgi:hypothetical protein
MVSSHEISAMLNLYSTAEQIVEVIRKPLSKALLGPRSLFKGAANCREKSRRSDHLSQSPHLGWHPAIAIMKSYGLNVNTMTWDIFFLRDKGSMHILYYRESKYLRERVLLTLFLKKGFIIS